MPNSREHFENSTLRERIVEHVFVGEVLRALWRRGIVDVELLHSEFDAFGYDLAFSRGAIMRHIQLKTGTAKKPGNVSVSAALADKPSGCVLWIRVTPELELGPYFWFGGAPGAALPLMDHYANPLRSTRNKTGQRPVRRRHRLVPSGAFCRLETIDEVLVALFGALPMAFQR